MATDGVKIIDGDTAHDIYWGIMNLYDTGAGIESIREQFPFPQTEAGYSDDDFEYEIYTTAYALAIWEIGYMTDDILKEVRAVIDKGACVRVWTEEYGKDEGKARQKELDKLWKKISFENQQVRKIKNYKLLTDFLFEINDVLTFQLNNDSYCATILLDIQQYRGNCTYEFGMIDYKEVTKPAIEDILEVEIIGRKIPSGHGMDFTKMLSMSMDEMMQQGGLEVIMKKEAERTGSFISGMAKIGIDHKDLLKITDKFSKIGTLPIKPEFRQTGSMSAASNYDQFTREFPDLNNYIKVFNADKFWIKDLVES